MNSRHNGGPPLDDDERGGWVAIARSMRRHPIVGFGVQVNPCDPSRGFCYSRAEAWIDLIMECRYRDGTVLNGGRRMTLKAGQLVGATSWLAQRWNWTPKTVEGFLRRLASDGMIVTFSPGVDAPTDRIDPGSEQFKAGQKKGQQKGKQAQIISVCNYTDFQVLPRGEGEASGVAAVLQRGSNGVAEGENLTKITKKQVTDAVVARDVVCEVVAPTTPTPPPRCAVEPMLPLAPSPVVAEVFGPSNPIPAAAHRPDLDDLQNRLMGACNGALADPVNGMGLLDLSVPLMWIDQGFDLDADILPTLRDVGRRKHGECISSWSYFTKAIASTKAKRQRGLTQVRDAARVAGDGKESQMERTLRMTAEIRSELTAKGRIS